MINLSRFVGKKVRVTFRNGDTAEGEISKDDYYSVFPFNLRCLIKDGIVNKCYTITGRFNLIIPVGTDIIQIEEIKPMSKYEELEKQVAEMQKEIDRLKREEKKYPDLKPMKVTRTVIYTPEEYFEHCKDWEEEPTQDGFREYASCWKRNADCFVDSDQYTQEIKVVEN
jgi:hypothetical protein